MNKDVSHVLYVYDSEDDTENFNFGDYRLPFDESAL
jgi:hypothetical protein